MRPERKNYKYEECGVSIFVSIVASSPQIDIIKGVSLSSVMTAESSLLPFVPPYTQSHERLEREVVYLVHGHCPTFWLAQHTQLIMFQKIADNKKFLSIQQKKVNWCLPRHACNPLIFREANGKYRMTICEL